MEINDKVKVIGIGLRESEWQQVEQIADQLGVSKHALSAYSVRDFLKRWEAGEIKTETKITLPGL